VKHYFTEQIFLNVLDIREVKYIKITMIYALSQDWTIMNMHFYRYTYTCFWVPGMIHNYEFSINFYETCSNFRTRTITLF
jgi:hypothetical protein